MGVSDEALGVIPGRTAPSADLGGSKFDPYYRYGIVFVLIFFSLQVANTQMRTLRTEVGKGSM